MDDEHANSTAATWVPVEGFGAGNETASMKFPRPGDTLAGGSYWLLLRADVLAANSLIATATTRADFGVACGAPITTIEASPARLSRTSSGTFLFNARIAAPLASIQSSNSSRDSGTNSGLPLSHFAVAYDRSLGSHLTATFTAGSAEASSESSAGSAWPTFSGTATLALSTEPALDTSIDICVFNFTAGLALKSSGTSSIAPTSSADTTSAAALLSLSDLSSLEVVLRPAAAEGTHWVTAGSSLLSPKLTWVTSTAASGSSSGSEVGYASAASADGVGGFFEVPRALLVPPGPKTGPSQGNCSRLALLAYLASPGRLRMRLSAAGVGDETLETRMNNVPSAAARLADHGQTTRPWETFDLGEGSSGAHSFAVAAVDQSGNLNGKSAFPEAMYAWTVDLTSVRTVLDSRPARTTESTSALFRFSCIDPTATASITSSSSSSSSSTSSSSHACSYDYVVLSGDQSGASTFTTGANTATASSNSNPVGWTPSGGLSLENLAEGAHTVRLRACRYPPEAASGNSTASANDDYHGDDFNAAARECDPGFLEWTWVVDTAKPETKILSGPPLMSNSTSAIFKLESSRPFSSHVSAGQTATPFLCRHTKPRNTVGQTGSSGSDSSNSDSSDSSGDDLNARFSDSRWTACWSATKLSGLAPGLHTLEARAVDAVGQVDQTPSKWTWLVHPFKVQEPIDGCPVLPLNTEAASSVGQIMEHVNVTVVPVDSAEDTDTSIAVGWAVTATSSSSSSSSASGAVPIVVAEGTAAGFSRTKTVAGQSSPYLVVTVPLPYPLGANMTANYTLEVRLNENMAFIFCIGNK